MIEWNFEPEIFKLPIGSFTLAPRYYGLMFILGFAIGYAYLSKLFKEAGRNVEREIPMLFQYVLLGTIIGARLGHCLFYDPAYYLTHPLEILKIWEGGLASHGGYLGVFTAVMLFLRRTPDISFFWLMDRIAPPALMTGGLIRVGNFFNSEIIGEPTDLPWGVVFQRLGPEYAQARHPAQLYEAIGYFLISGLLFYLVRKHKEDWRSGRILGVTFILGWTWRFCVEFVKINQVSFEDGMSLNMGQLLSIPFIIIGFLLFFEKHIGVRWLRIFNEPLLRSKEDGVKTQVSAGKSGKPPRKSKRKS